MKSDDWVYVVGTRSDDYRFPKIKGLIGRVVGKDKTYIGQYAVQFFSNRSKTGWFSFTDNVYPENVRPATKDEVNTFLMRIGIENEELPKPSPYFRMKTEMERFLKMMQSVGRYGENYGKNVRLRA